MTRAQISAVLIVVSLCVMLSLPHVLTGWAIAAWWTSLGVMFVGVLNICHAILEGGGS